MNYIDVHVHPLTSVENIVNSARRAGVDKIFLLAIEIYPKALDRSRVRDFLKRLSLESVFMIDLEIYKMYGVSDLREALRRFFDQLIERYGGEKYLSEDVASIASSVKEIDVIPFGSVYPDLNLDVLNRRLETFLKIGVRGVKLLPTLQLFDPSSSEGFLRILEFAERNRMIVTIHTGCDPGPFEIPLLSQWANPIRLMKVLEIYSPTMILAHTGSYCAYRYGIWFNEAVRVMKKFDNVYGDTAAVNDYLFYSEKTVDTLRREVGFERVLFGSDYPVVLGSDIESEVNIVLESPYLTSREKELVLRDNAIELVKRLR